MKFLFIQIIIVTLVCIFFAALSNLTELGIVGWIIAASTGHGLYRIYRHLHSSMKAEDSKRKCEQCSSKETNLSKQLRYIMFDDATRVNDD